MSAVHFNDYANYTNYTNYGTDYDFSSLTGRTANPSGSLISDYASIKSGSYGKLLKAYYAKRDVENASVSGDSRQELTLMRSSADSLKKSANVPTLKSLFTGTGSFADRISGKAASLSRVALNAAARVKGTTYTKNGSYSDTLSKLFSSTLDKKIGDDKNTSSNTSSKTASKKEDEEKKSNQSDKV